MSTEHLLSKSEYCEQYHIEVAFVDSLHEYGLIEMLSVEGKHFIQETQLQQLERFTRLHYDLDVNLEGIDVIAHMLNRVKGLQDEIQFLKARLQVYHSSE